MTRDQRTVLAGALAGIAAMLLAMWLLCTLLPAPGLPTLAGSKIEAAYLDEVAREQENVLTPLTQRGRDESGYRAEFISLVQRAMAIGDSRFMFGRPQ